MRRHRKKISIQRTSFDEGILHRIFKRSLQRVDALYKGKYFILAYLPIAYD